MAVNRFHVDCLFLFPVQTLGLKYKYYIYVPTAQSERAVWCVFQMFSTLNFKNSVLFSVSGADFSDLPNRNRWSQTRRRTWPTESMPSVTWSAQPRRRTAWGRCSRWPPGRRCRPRDGARRAAAFCYRVSGDTALGGKGKQTRPRKKRPSSGSALSLRWAQLNGALQGGGRTVKPGQRGKKGRKKGVYTFKSKVIAFSFQIKTL